MDDGMSGDDLEFMESFGGRDLEERESARDRSRYYSSETSRVTCYRCQQTGHIAVDCDSTTAPERTCGLCALPGHNSHNCPRDLCYNCLKPGHRSSDCAAPRSHGKTKCNKCNRVGHLQSACSSWWREYRTAGDAPRAIRADLRRFCYQCGAAGHFGDDCRMSGRYVYQPTAFHEPMGMLPRRAAAADWAAVDSSDKNTPKSAQKTSKKRERTPDDVIDLTEDSDSDADTQGSRDNKKEDVHVAKRARHAPRPKSKKQRPVSVAAVEGARKHAAKAKSYVEQTQQQTQVHYKQQHPKQTSYKQQQQTSYKQQQQQQQQQGRSIQGGGKNKRR